MIRKFLYQQIAALCILSAFLTQTFNRNLVIIDYYTHMRRYAIHCENKSRPVLHCNGKCQMLKKLRQEQKKDEENPERKAENKSEFPLSTPSFVEALHHPLTGEKPARAPLMDIGHPVDRTPDIFHPPQVSIVNLFSGPRC